MRVKESTNLAHTIVDAQCENDVTIMVMAMKHTLMTKNEYLIYIYVS